MGGGTKKSGKYKYTPWVPVNFDNLITCTDAVGNIVKYLTPVILRKLSIIIEERTECYYTRNKDGSVELFPTSYKQYRVKETK